MLSSAIDDQNPESETPAAYVAFIGHQVFVEGCMADVVPQLHAYQQKDDASLVLLFDASNGKQLDLDLRDSLGVVMKRYGLDASVSDIKPVLDGDSVVKKKRGRPKLGVKGREVTLLPRHWQWLDSQPGGASAALRRLVDDNRKKMVEQDSARKAQDASYRFISAIAGNLPGYEEAIRALFAKDKRRFIDETKLWPKAVLDYVLKFSARAF